MAQQAFLLVGLGTIAQTHYEVLAADPAVQIVGGVDPSSAVRGVEPIFADLDAALRSGIKPDWVVIATPTPTHIAIAEKVLSESDARVLSEKPLALQSEDIAHLERVVGRDELARRLKVAHHFAFSPEVEWADDVVSRHPEWGQPTRVLCVSNDKYGDLPASQLGGYVSSWVDSGPNQLSVLSRFAKDWAVTSHESTRDRAVTMLEHDGGTTTLVSNWLAGDTSKQTVLEYEEGAIHIRIDHTSMTGLVFEAGKVTAHLAYTGKVGRKVAHYAGLYRVLLSGADDKRMSVAVARDIADVLEASTRTPTMSPLEWTASG